MASWTKLGVLALSLVVLVEWTAATTETSTGKGGEPCGDKVCLAGEAKCVTSMNVSSCKCNDPYTHGNGIFGCYRKNEFKTEVTNDPRIITYNGRSIDLPVPCRYLLTHAVTDYKGKKRTVKGSCEVMVHAVHKKVKGKFYVHGYQVAIRVECNNGSRYEMSIAKHGTAESGFYKFIINGTNGSFSPNGPWGSHVINFHDKKTNLRIKCEIDHANNMAVLAIKKCGIKIRFRLYDVVLRRDQPLVPGLGVSVNCAYNPELESVDKVIALAPKDLHNGFNIESILLEDLGPMETLIYRVYMSGVEQTKPDPNPYCSEAKSILMKCKTHDNLKKVFAECLWILKSPRFINCHDKTTNGAKIQKLFNRCADIYCGDQKCTDVIDMISTTCKAVPGYPQLNEFVSGRRCP